MSLTAAQKGTSAQVGIGGDALQALLGYVVSAHYTATITASALLTDAAGAGGGFGVTFATDTQRIVLIPRGDMYWKIAGAASAATARIGQGLALNMPLTKALADTIYVYAAGGGVVCDLLVCTPR